MCGAFVWAGGEGGRDLVVSIVGTMTPSCYISGFPLVCLCTHSMLRVCYNW